jgi:hypothetical protein
MGEHLIWGQKPVWTLLGGQKRYLVVNIEKGIIMIIIIMIIYVFLTFFYVLSLTENHTKRWPFQPENMTTGGNPNLPNIDIFILKLQYSPMVASKKFIKKLK